MTLGKSKALCCQSFTFIIAVYYQILLFITVCIIISNLFMCIFHMHQQDILWAPDDNLSVSSPHDLTSQ